MPTSILKAPRPPWTSLGKELESATRKAIYDFQLLEGVEKVAIALSGGKDSLSLLFLLHALRGRGFPHFELIAIHVSGEFSCGAGVDGGFLSRICKELEIPLIVRESERKTLEGLECYSCSRERRRLLFTAAKEANATTIAFGHHRDDSAQTLLLNLLHKAEFAANLPKVVMQHFGITLIRPLIYIKEADLKSFAQMYGFARITCQCPVGQTSKRQSVKDLLKQIEREFPHATGNLAQAGLQYGSNKALTP